MSGVVGSRFCLLFVPNTLLVALGLKTTRFQRFESRLTHTIESSPTTLCVNFDFYIWPKLLIFGGGDMF